MKRGIPEKLPMLRRSLQSQVRVIRADGQEEEQGNEPIEIALSSETPVERWGGFEILDHSTESIDRTLADRGLALLVGHDQGEFSRLQVGLVENLEVGSDRVLRGKARFSSDPEAQRIRQDMIDGIRPYISVGYRVHEVVLERQDESGETYRVTRWTPGEVSTVAVPADASVGVGRKSEGSEELPVRVRRTAESAAKPSKQENRKMKRRADEESQIDEENMEEEETEEHMDEEETEEHGRKGRQLTSRRDIAQALEARNKEVAEITQLAIAHGQGERAGEFIASGKSAGQVALDILSGKRSRPFRQGADETRKAPGLLTDASKNPQYSLRAAIAGAVGQTEGQRWGGFEAECDQEIRRALPRSYKGHDGIFVPESQSVSPELARAMARMLGMKTRAGLDAHTSTAGAELVFDIPGDFIDLLRNMTVVNRLGATTLAGLSSPVTFPKQTGAGTATWVGENPGSDVADSDLALGTIALAPKTIMSSTAHSRQLLAQESFDVEALIRRDMAAIHALAIDKAAIHGTGASNQPTGIYAAAGVNSKAMGGAVAYGELVDMATEVALDNALTGTTGFATSPGMAGKLMQTLEFPTAPGGQKIWVGAHAEGVVAGYRAVSSNQISKVMSGSTETGGSEYGIVFGNWSDLILGTWGALELVVDPYSLKKQAMIEVTSFQLADILLRHGESFCKSTGATLA